MERIENWSKERDLQTNYASFFSRDNHTHAFTLTFKQAQRFNNVYVPLTNEIARRQMHILINRVNEAVYGNAFKRKYKKIGWIAVLGNGPVDGFYNGNCLDTSKRLHYHVAAAFPEWADWDECKELVLEIWGNLKDGWAYDQNWCSPIYNSGWLEYMVDHTSDCVDVLNCHFTDDFRRNHKNQQ